MGSCTRRHFLLSTCFLQMITIIERQVFDFLGYMWAPIFVNFFHIIFVIFGFYGAYHFRIKYIITYLIWNFIWIGWNSFLICFYLNVGTLDRDSDTLNLGTGSFSWFEVNGFGCKPTYPTNITTDDPYRPIRPERVDDCLLDYSIIEIIHSGVQCALAFFGILGAILISYIFLDEDDRFDFMNGDAKSPQHTVVHPMYVSYSSIPTSASATLLSNKHHQQQKLNQHNSYNNSHHNHQFNTETPETLQRQQQQQQHHKQKLQQLSMHSPTTSLSRATSSSYNNTSLNNNNNSNSNTFLIHANSKRSNKSNDNNHNSSHSLSNSLITTGSNRKIHAKSNHKVHNANFNSNSKQETLTRMQNYQRQLQLQQQHQQQQQYAGYDDSTAKADQVYSPNNWPQYAQQNYETTATTPNSSHENTTSSLSYASLQNSNATIATAAGGVGGASSSIAGIGAGGIETPFNHSNFSLNNNYNSNINCNTAATTNSAKNHNHNHNSAGRFARIHGKPKPPKSSSYSSFISNNSLSGGGGSGVEVGEGVGDGNGASNVSSLGSASNLYRPDIKYTQMSNDRLSSNYEEAEDDNFSLKNFKVDGGITYVPFQKPTPAALFINANHHNNNNNQLGTSETIPNIFQQISPNNNTNINMNNSNTTSSQASYGILLERGAILQPALLDEPALNPIKRYPGTPSPAYRRRFLSNNPHHHHHHYPYQPTRPTNIPLPVIPSEQFNDFNESPLGDDNDDDGDDQMPSPPPPPMSAPRPHIFQPRSGNAPYPDLSPEVTERYAMPTQYIPRSPIASRIARRQRQQQQQQETSKLALNSKANYCDKLRDTPPPSSSSNVIAYDLRNQQIVRAKSHDRLTSTASSPLFMQQQQLQQLSPIPQIKSQQISQPQTNAGPNLELAPHVNRRSGRRSGDGKTRPRSYCNSINGEDVIRGIGIVGGNAAVHASNYPMHIV